MKQVLAALSVGAVLLGGVGAAFAGVTSTPATVVIAGSEEAGDRWVTVNALLETSPVCRADREVKVLARYGEWTHRHVWAPGPWEPVATVTSGRDGSVAGTVRRPTLWAVKFKVAPADRGRRHTCGGAVGGMRFELS